MNSADKSFLTSLFNQMKEEIIKELAPPPSIMSFSEAASYIKVSEAHLYEMNVKRVIPFTKPGGKLVYYQKRDLDKWISRNPVHSKEEINSIAETRLSKVK